MKPLTSFALAVLLVLAVAGSGLAKDLDDGIGSDDGFEFDNTLKKGTNVKYQKVRAKAQAKRDQDGTVEAGSGDTNINSAVVGGNVYGDIIIIDEGKSDKTVVKK